MSVSVSWIGKDCYEVRITNIEREDGNNANEIWTYDLTAIVEFEAEEKQTRDYPGSPAFVSCGEKAVINGITTEYGVDVSTFYGNETILAEEEKVWFEDVLMDHLESITEASIPDDRYERDYLL